LTQQFNSSSVITRWQVIIFEKKVARRTRPTLSGLSTPSSSAAQRAFFEVLENKNHGRMPKLPKQAPRKSRKNNYPPAGSYFDVRKKLLLSLSSLKPYDSLVNLVQQVRAHVYINLD
jgi:hypothetical protein